MFSTVGEGVIAPGSGVSLSVKEGPDLELHRVVRIAHLRGADLSDIVPPLHDVQLIELRTG